MSDFQNSLLILVYLMAGTISIAALMTWLLKRMK